ncbi:putative ribonuclease H-like domain-containing protein [Tanacetum coccineum]
MSDSEHSTVTYTSVSIPVEDDSDIGSPGFHECITNLSFIIINCDNHQRKGIISRNNYSRVDAKTTHSSVHRNMSPRAVLLKTGLTPLNTVRPVNTAHPKSGKPQHDDKGFVDSGCSRHMTGNIAYLSDFKEFDGGYVAFGGGAYGGRITSKGTLKTDNLDFKDVYFVNELKFNLFSVSQMCDKKNYVLFTDTECLVLSPNFKLPNENQILLKIPRKDNMYSFDMKNIVPKKSLTCLVAKATLDESMLWHRRLGHINFKNINKFVKDNLLRGLHPKRFENDQTCVACLKGKQHRASCKSKVLNPITKPLFMLHMDLFGPTFVSSLMHKKYCLVVTDDYSRFTWVFFLTTKDETSEILKNFIKEIENLVDKKVKIIRSDNGTEFKNKVLDDFCREKGIKREYSVARTPQQNGVAERRNMTLIEAARTMLADSKLPTTFWAEAVSTACYVQNRVLVVKPHNKTPYELFRGFKPALSFMRPFGCHVTILNTLDSLGKFDSKSGKVRSTVSNVSAGTSEENSQDCIVMPIWKVTSYLDSPTKNVDNKKDGIFISQDKYVAKILKKFNYSDVKFASTPVDLEKPLVKDGDADDVNVHLYRSMIGSLMYLTASRPDIMFAVCACARFQVTPKTSHLLSAKRIFRYLKGKPTLGLWYSRDSPFELVAYTNSDYAGATQDRKSTTGGCQFLGNRLISWQCKKQSVVATSTTEAEYMVVVNCCGQVGDEAVHKELGDRMERAATTASSLEAEQDSGSGPRLKLVLPVFVSAVKRMLMLPVQVSAIEEGTDCLPTATIFEELARMGYEKPSQKLTFYKAFFSPQWKYFIHTITQCLSAKSTAWNEFSSSMASLIICLATNQKFNLSKYIFDAMVKHLDGGVKFLLYPCFLQVFINQQLGNMSTHKKIFVNPFHTKKVFANMKRAGKDFSRRITPLFDTMMVQPVEEMGEDSDHPTDSTPIHICSSERAEHEESIPTPSNDPQPSGEDSMQLTDLMVLCTKLQTHVLDLQKAKDAQAKEIAGLKKRIQSLGAPEDASKQGRSIEDIDANVDVSLVDETQERQDDDLMFDTRVLEDDEMHVEAKVDGKDEQSTKPDDSTAGEAVTTASVDDSAVPTTIKEITLAQTL